MYCAAPTLPQNILLNNQNNALQLRNGVNLFEAYKEIQFSGVTGTLRINEHGTRVLQASLQNFVDTSWVEIGHNDVSSTQLQFDSEPTWSSATHVKPWGQAEVMYSLIDFLLRLYSSSDSLLTTDSLLRSDWLFCRTYRARMQLHKHVRRLPTKR